MPFIFFALVGVLAFAVGRAAVHAQPPASPAPPRLPAPSYAPPAPQVAGLPLPPGVPSPLTVLGHMMSSGQFPPPQIVACAIAEARIVGDDALADRISAMFATPSANPAPRAPMVAPQASQPWPSSSPAPDASQMEPIGWDETGAPIMAPPPVDIDALHAAIAAMGMPSGHVERTFADDHEIAMQPPTPDAANIMVAGELAYAPQSHHSPIPSIEDQQWDAFAQRVEREPMTFATDKHVGRYRQRRERLVALGIDPDRIVRCTDAQLDALAQEMRDAYHHLTASGLAEYVGRAVVLPPEATADRRGARVTITLSGLLGLSQAAGLEGAAGWLDRPADRRVFPHSTAAFVRTNGVF